MDWRTVWSVIRDFGGAAGTVLVALSVWPGSPLKKIVESWIAGRVAHQFDKQLEKHKHDLTVLADIERARLQHTLQNSAIVVQRKHEIYRRLFQQLHRAMGKVVHLFGSTSFPAFDAFDRDDLEHYMRRQRFPGTVRTAVLNAWDTDRKWAIKQLQATTRHGEIEDAQRAFARAWNYFLGNELYLPDPIAQKVHQAFQPLEKTLNLAKTQGARGDYTAWGQEASTRVTELKNLLRAELRVVDDDPGTTVAQK